MPQMGVSVSEGTLVAWHKSVGDRVEKDEPICEISSDKVDTDCPSPAAGVLAEILVEVGQTVEVGTVLARLAQDEAAGNGAPPARLRSSPVARRIAAAHNLELDGVRGTGRDGRVTKKDVLAAVESDDADGPEPLLHTESPYRADDGLDGAEKPLSRIRQSIGAAMLRSQEVTATCHTVVECDMARVERLRRELGLKALPLVAHAAIATLAEFPDLNATLDDVTITRHQRVHLGIAVSLGADGLIVPVIHDAQDLSPSGLASRIADLAERARSKQLVPDDVQGGTFTITNPGAYGALIATPVIALPQVAILDLEAITRRPVVVTDAEGRDSIAIRPIVNLCMGWDHRALDGVYAARFLGRLRHRLETAGAPS